jgi:SWI/SNF-related matrix-associated actin-dependent regulator of chromatin subfamily D
VYVFHARDATGTYALRVVGRRVDARREDVDRGGSNDGAWTHDDGERRLTSYVRRMTIEVAGDGETATTRTWTREDDDADARGTRGSGRTDGFEMRGCAKGDAVEATIRLEVNGMRERFRVGMDLAELIGTRYATRRRLIAELWTYFTANELVNDDDVSEVRVDEPMRVVLEGAGLSIPMSPGTVKFQRVCDVACEKFLTALEPLEIKYKITNTESSLSKPDCYDIEAEEPDDGPWGLPPPYEQDYRVAKDIDACEQHIRRAFQYIDNHLERRDFLLRFAESPIDFINSCILNQAKGVYTAEDVTPGVTGELRYASRASDTYKHPWLDEAAMRLLE